MLLVLWKMAVFHVHQKQLNNLTASLEKAYFIRFITFSNKTTALLDIATVLLLAN